MIMFVRTLPTPTTQFEIILDSFTIRTNCNTLIKWHEKTSCVMIFVRCFISRTKRRD